MTRIAQFASRLADIRVIVGAFIILALTYSLATPLFETPDEPSHFAYIKSLVDGNGFPIPPIVIADNQAAQESSQPPMYYLTAALAVRVFAPDSSNFEAYLIRNPAFPYLAETYSDNKNIFLHSAPENFPYEQTALAVHIARLIAICFGALTVAATYGLAREVFPDRKSIAVIAALIVAFTPQFVFISGAASNDSSAAALCALTLWCTTRVMQRGFTFRRSIVLGVLLGLAMLSKASAIALVPLIALALVFWNPIDRLISIGSRMRWAILIVVIAGVIAAPWYVRSLNLFGDIFGITPHLGTPWARLIPISIGEAFTQLPGALTSYWLAFGWGNILMPDWVYLLLNIIALGGLCGVVLWIRHSANSIQKWIPLILIVWAAIILAALIRWIQLLNAPLGRLIFPAISAISILITLGWLEISRRIRLNVVAALIPIPFFVLSVTALPSLLQPAYARPQILSALQIDQQPGRSIDVRYGDVARLIKIDVPRSNWPQAGSGFEVNLCWEPLARDERMLMELVQIVGAENRVVSTRRTLPGLGSYPTSIWQIGQSFCDRMYVQVAENIPMPAIYKIEVSLIDQATQNRLPALASDGSQLATHFVDTIKIAPKVYATPQIDRPLDYRLGDQIELIGYSIDPTAIERGGVVHLRLYWRALKRLLVAYTVFLHLQDSAGQLIAQADSQPQHDSYPTSFWDATEVVIDDRSIQIPADALTGTYTIAVGLYNPIGGTRLQVVGTLDNSIDLPLQVEVR